MSKDYDLGKEGEQLAVEYLQKNQYEVLERNWRYLKAEVDIIAIKEQVLVCVEVKTRTSDYFGDPQDFVSPKKIKLLVEAMNHYVVLKDLNVEVRFDIVALTKNSNQFTIEHLEDAFLHF